MEHEERDRGREEEKESCSDGEHPDRSNDRGEGGPEVDVEVCTVWAGVQSCRGEPLFDWRERHVSEDRVRQGVYTVCGRVEEWMNTSLNNMRCVLLLMLR